MAAIIAAECPKCRQVYEQPSGGYVLYRCMDRRSGDFYTFTCGCGFAAAKPADVQVAALLIAHLVRVVRLRTPLELSDVQRNHALPLGWDDVLDFISELQAWDGSDRAGFDRTGEGVASAGA